MNTMYNLIQSTRLSIWLLLCVLILAATSVYAAGDQRPLAAVDVLGSPDAAVNGQFAVGTATPGNKALTVAGVIDFVGAGTVHNYFTQGPGNNMQIRSNVDEYNTVGNGSYAQWNMVMGASLDVFSIRRSPASSTYNEDALFWIEGDTGNIGVAKVDTSNGAAIPFTLEARLHVETDTGGAIIGISTDTSSSNDAIYGEVTGPNGRAVHGYASATTGSASGVYGETYTSSGYGVFGYAGSTTGSNFGVFGQSSSTSGTGVYGYASASTGTTHAVFGLNESSAGYGVYGGVFNSSGENYGVYGISSGDSGYGIYGNAMNAAGTNYGVYGESASTSGYDFYAGGAGTDYGPFTGAHEVLLSDSIPTDVQAGMIVSATGEAHIRQVEDGSVDISSTLPTVKLADTIEDKAVLGVIVAEVNLPEDHWYIPAAGDRFASINALGEGRVWVANINGDIEAGDYITTSRFPGYGQRQESSQLNNYTLAKATETIDWDSVTETMIFEGQEYKVYLLAVVYTSG